MEHRTTKATHPWTNGQVERMNRTIKDATVRRFHDESHDQLRQHLADVVAAYNFGRRLNTLKGITPYEFICKAWASQPERRPPPSSIVTRLAFLRERGAGGGSIGDDAGASNVPTTLDRCNQLNKLLCHRTIPSACTRTCSLQAISARRPARWGYEVQQATRRPRLAASGLGTVWRRDDFTDCEHLCLRI